MSGKQEPTSDSSLIKLPRSSYNELAKIIMAYSIAAKPSSLDEIAQRSGVNKYSVSSNNVFLTAVGLIEGGKAKMATELGLNLGRALEHEITEDISIAWKQVIQQNSFFNKIISAVRIRRFFETSSFESHIAYSSGEPKSPQIMTGARTIVEILKIAGIISEADGKIILTPSSGGEVIQVAEKHTEISRFSDKAICTTQYGQVLIQINLNVNIDSDSLEGIGEKLRKIIKDVESLQIIEDNQQS